ncbi:MAG TPA: HU family DNA-binding protein [Firmicutes bacterium]|nr:HU family DNA-binding protein [Bacillota bacterium]
MKTGFKKVDADKAVDAVFEAIREELSLGGAVAVTGFGKFAGRERGPRKARNIRTGEAIVVPPRRAPVFTAGKTLKEAVAE